VLDSPASEFALLSLFAKLEKVLKVVRRARGDVVSLLRVKSAFGLDVMFGARDAPFKS